MKRSPVAPGDRNVPWRDAFPPAWDLKPVKYLCAINQRALPETTDPDTEFRYVDIGSVDSEGNWTTSEPVRFGEAPSRARRVVTAGDVLVSTVRTYLRAITHVDKVEDRLICSTGFAVLSANGAVDPRFLAYWARSAYFVDEVVARSVGVSYPAVNAADVGNIPCPVLPLDEQRAIARYLDRETARIDALIEKKRRQIELLQEKRAALISHAVTKGLDPNVPMKDSGIEWLGDIPAEWTVKRIKHVVQIRSGQVDPRIDEYSAMPLVAPNHLESRTGRLLPHQTAEDQGAISGKYVFRAGDVLYSKIRPELAKACVAPADGLCSADMYAMVPKPGHDARYVLYLLLSDAFTKLAIDESMRVAMPKINREDLGELRLPIAPEGEQARIVEFLSSRTGVIDTLVEKLSLSIDLLREYRSALISAAVTGKIDVRKEVA